LLRPFDEIVWCVDGGPCEVKILGDAVLENTGKNIWPSKRKWNVEVLLQSRVDRIVRRGGGERKITVVTTCGNNARRRNCEECVL
jgi:hypothetical protein